MSINNSVRYLDPYGTLYIYVTCLYSKLQWFSIYIVCLIQEIVLGIIARYAVWNSCRT